MTYKPETSKTKSDKLYQNTRNFSFRNVSKIKTSKKAGCYQCCTIFSAELVKDFVDDGETALCPNCSIDSVLPDCNFILTPQYLRELREYWFGDSK